MIEDQHVLFEDEKIMSKNHWIGGQKHLVRHSVYIVYNMMY